MVGCTWLLGYYFVGRDRPLPTGRLINWPFNKRIERMIPKKVLQSLTLASVVFVVSGCSQLEVKTPSGVDLASITPLYTLSNLHPDPKRHKLSAVNHQLAGLIPLCTEVDVVSIKNKAMKFLVKDTGQQYVFVNHRAIVGGLAENLPSYFGSQCNKSVVNGLGKIDKKGIRLGVPLVGMSKKGVELAMGMPPKHRTRSLELNTWIYWRNNWGTMAVNFDEAGKVSSIK